MFKTRLISGILLVLAAFLTINCGGIVLFVTLIGVSIFGIAEILRAMQAIPETEKNKHFNLFLMAVLLVAVYYGLMEVNAGEYQMMGIVLVVILLMAYYVFTYPRYQAQQIMAAFFAVFYVGVMLSYIYLTRMMEDGRFHVWLIFLSAWGCDTCAYCVGMLIGKHKMAPVLSPKKSIEGAVGGVVGAALLGVLFAYLTKGDKTAYAVICGVGALISMVGDLAASAIKRNQGIKDYGKLIPGHGGILDRFDSVIFIAPIIYYLLVLLM